MTNTSLPLESLLLQPTITVSTNVTTAQPQLAHYYPPSSRKVTSRKTQLRWIVQTVQKIQARNNTGGGGRSSSKRTDPIENDHTVIVHHHQNQVQQYAPVLLDGLELLSSARTQAQVLEAGRMIEAVDVCRTQPLAIQERVIKAAAMTGLLHLALTIVEHMLLVSCHLPSPICQDAMANGLRRAGRIQRLGDLLCQFGNVARAQNKSISLIAFNTYLAALCDIVTEKDGAIKQQRGENYIMGDLDLSGDTSDGKAAALDRAWYWIENLDRTVRSMAVMPDSVSYATVIQAAAFMGNQTIVDAIWKALQFRKVQPNIVAYNARLRTTNVSTSSRRTLSGFGRQKKGDQEILQVWDTEISQDRGVCPDKFSIDLLLLPLIRSGRVGDVESLLDSFIKRNSETVVSNSFTAFLYTVVAGGELASARALFEMYILPTLSPVMVGDAGGMIRMVRPTTRHFNVLIEGYRKRFQNENKESSTRNDFVNNDSANEAWSLYRLMLQSLSARPDSYTITSMMGLCQTSTELSNLLYQAVADLDIECSAVVLRAACKSICSCFNPIKLYSQINCYISKFCSDGIWQSWRRFKCSLVVFKVLSSVDENLECALRDLGQSCRNWSIVRC
jgi:Pentatricopeptide repeat domain